MAEPMKPAEAWAHVDRETGEVTFIGGPQNTSLEVIRGMHPTERLARVRITEVEEK